MKKASIITLLLLAMAGISLLSCNLTNTFFATPTPTTTNTPTITPSPIPTNTATPTTTPTPVPTGVTTENQADSSILFIDYDNKYRLSLPSDWTVVSFNLESISDNFAIFADENPDFAEAVKAFEMLDEDMVRAIALNNDPKFVRDGFATNLTIVAIEEPILTSMPIAFIVSALEDGLVQGGAKILTDANVTKNIEDIEIGIIEVENVVPTASGKNVSESSRILVFLSENKFIMVQLATQNQFRDELFPTMDYIKDSISLLE